MKLAVIGGGGVRSLFLAKSLAPNARRLGIDTLVFMDNDADKLRLFGGMAVEVGKRLAPDVTLTLTTDAVSAVTDADYVITTLRVGGDAMRCRDEHLALDLGVLGQETTGAAGFSYAMRSIPALVAYCEMVKRHAKPGCKVFNFTNPVGIVSQALNDLGYDFSFGICDAPANMLHQFADFLGLPAGQLDAELFGLNHLSWFHSVSYQGEELMDRLLGDPAAREHTDLRFFTPALLAHVGCIPNEYLYYFYWPQEAVHNIKKAGKTRGDVILEIGKAMQKEMAGLDPVRDFDKCLAIFSYWYGRREDMYMASETGVKRDKPWSFDLYGADAGGYAGVAMNYIDIVQKGSSGQMILSVPNHGAVDFLTDNAVVEATCDIGPDGNVTPHRFDRVPPEQQELIRRVKYYELTGARAIVKRSRRMAIDALMLHPLVGDFDTAVSLVDSFITLNAAFTGPWED